MTLNFRILQINLGSKKYMSNFGTEVQIPKVLKDTVNKRGAQLSGDLIYENSFQREAYIITWFFNIYQTIAKKDLQLGEY